MFQSLGKAYANARKLFQTVFDAAGSELPSRNSLKLRADEYLVKKKLGKRFFTGQLTANCRAARISSLTRLEHSLARRRGWIR